MKRYTTIIPSLVALACCLLLAACTSDLPGNLSATGDPAARPLAITVSDGGMYSTPDPDRQTRAEEQGYQTVFTEGDRIGLYVVKNGAIEIQNLCLTLRGGKWTLPAGVSGLYHVPGRDYYAYYPYKNDMYMSDKVSASSSGNGFFSPLVTAWAPNSNQSTYANYTASDLMTAQGNCNSDGNYTLNFSLEHRMALVVFQLPTTQYHYSEKIDNIDIPKSYYRYTMVRTPFMHENPSTGRFLINPQGIANSINFYYYSNGRIESASIDFDELKLQPGRYTIHQVDGGAVTESQRPLEEGDFYMKDGTILPHDAFPGGMPANVQEDCLGVVFWVGEKKSDYGIAYHWTHENANGDQLLMHDHPGCTHGLVVALKDVATDRKPWSSTDTNGATYTWLNSFAATGQEAEKKLIYVSNPHFGYVMSRRHQWYRNYGEQCTEAYDAIEAFAKAYPTPAGCSGWYFPGDYEMTVMARGTLKHNEDNNMGAMLNKQFGKARGNRFNTDNRYWSSTDSELFPGKGYFIRFSDNLRNMTSKQDECYVRAVLAF